MAKDKEKYTRSEMVSISAVSNLHFQESLQRQGYWVEQINRLIANPDKMLKIHADDSSSLQQIRNKAADRKVKLLFARQADFIYVRIWMPSEEQQRLVLLLREPRTVNEIKAKGLEVNVESELKYMSERAQAEFKNGKWQLTKRGADELLPTLGAKANA